MKNPLTTIFGVLTAAGLFLAHNSNPVLASIGTWASTIGAAVLGIGAKDSSNSN